MKIKLITVALWLNFNCLLLAQTADDYVSQGRDFLSATNIVAANGSFSNAVALSPNHETANVFYAITRLMVLPSQPVGSNFLDRIGMPIAGRDIYNWTAKLPTGAHDVPLAPAGVNANESAAILRTNVLPALIAAEANLATVTDTSFVLTLTSNETRIVEVTLDYGDIQMFRAMLQAVEYFAYSTYSWNFDAQLDAIHSLHTSEQLSIERLLMDYPNLLTYATTNDLAAAKLAFQNGVDRYMAASQIIRDRPTDVMRLFNYDAGQAATEEKFRLTLTDLVNSLSTAVTLAVETNYTVFMGAHFSGTHPLRSFLPSFLAVDKNLAVGLTDWFTTSRTMRTIQSKLRGTGFELGTLPDPTFGGLIYGLTGQQVDENLAKYLFPIPTLPPNCGMLGGQFQFPINVAKGRGYVIQASTNLLDWDDCSSFFAVDGSYNFTDQNSLAFPGRFYRVVDRTGNMPPPANDAFDNRAPVSSMNVPVTGYTVNASTEMDEPASGGVGHTVWWSWTSPISAEVAVLASGGGNCWPINIFTGGSLNGLTQVANGWGEIRFYAQAGETYQIAVDTCWQDSGVKLVITRPPTIVVTSPADGAVFTSPANISISGSASDPDGQIQQISIQAWSDLNFKTSSSSFSFQWTNVPGGYYYLNFSATDDAGCQAWDSRSIRVHPVNDDFTNTTAISGAPLTVSGSNAGADKEVGEPDHAGNSGGSSVWWSWTPASTGPVTITTAGSSFDTILAAYTGNSVGGLSLVGDNDDYNGYTTSQISFLATAGTVYQIAVDGFNGSSGSIALNLSQP